MGALTQTLKDELGFVQDEMHIWRAHNFPNGDAEQQLLGVMEELGELCHARLKYIQGIRGISGAQQLEHLERDAIGDLLIFLAGYCSYRGIHLDECLEKAWDEVKDRDWRKYPETGLPPLKEVP